MKRCFQATLFMAKKLTYESLLKELLGILYSCLCMLGKRVCSSRTKTTKDMETEIIMSAMENLRKICAFL